MYLSCFYKKCCFLLFPRLQQKSILHEVIRACKVRLSVGEPTSIAWRMLSQTPPWGTRINPTVMQSLVSHAAPLQTEDRDSNAIIPPPPVVLQNTSRKDIITPVIPPPSDARRQQPLPTTANDQSSDSDNDDVPNVPRDIDDFGAGYGSDPEDDSSSFVAAVEPARSVSHEHCSPQSDNKRQVSVNRQVSVSHGHCSPQSDNKRQVSVNRPQSENDEEIHGAPEVNRPPGGGVFAGGSVSSLSAAEEYGGEEEDSRDVEYKADVMDTGSTFIMDFCRLKRHLHENVNTTSKTKNAQNTLRSFVTHLPPVSVTHLPPVFVTHLQPVFFTSLLRGSKHFRHNFRVFRQAVCVL
eukprot:GEMP01067006.1.p1 GENE.GEMP01067006.1~~GEMP01067006.1.p1  ORF type:complete len:351 (+),score=35.57 GEMP01067006.1:10-1062(+)